MIADGTSIHQAVAIEAVWDHQGPLNWFGEPLTFLRAKCCGCGQEAFLSGPGRHRCRRCGLWLLYVPKDVVVSLG
jgi:hypothetical protein